MKRPANYTDISTPLEIAGEFIGFAREFHAASVRLNAAKPFLSHPTYYCVLHAIELALKAQLVALGLTKKELQKDFSHNLPKLLAKWKGIGNADLILSQQEQRIIDKTSRDYAAKGFEYPECLVTTVGIGNFMRIADKLIRSFRE